MKRNVHSYKCHDQVYKDAVKKAKKEKTTVAELIESWLYSYAKPPKKETEKTA